jgi:cysteine desulfurase / selenocysteine lyase
MINVTDRQKMTEKKLRSFSAYKDDFPILKRRQQGRPLIYLDSAASTQKPQAVLEEMARFYRENYANIHRGVYQLSQEATQLYEGARETVRQFLGARDGREIVFVRGTTEGINLLAATLGRDRVGPGDEIIISHLEHHANIVPWQILCREVGATLKVIPIDESGQIQLDVFLELLSDKTRLISIAHVSNALGTILPVQTIIAEAKRRGIPVVLDGAQGAAHFPVDVQELDCDFYLFSGHKLYGPTGIGVLYGRLELLQEMPPYQSGGDMIRTVSFEETTFADPPHRFEAGTPHIAGAIGLAAAIKYLNQVGWAAIVRHETELVTYGTELLSQVPGLKLVGTAGEKVAVFSFVLDYAHPHDIATILDGEGIAVRAGHHCAQPLMDRFGLSATTRASLGLYNSKSDLEALVDGLSEVRSILHR